MDITRQQAVSEDAVQYLTFNLADEVFGLDIEKVREVLDLVPITRVPQTAEFMKGVINLRGSVVPVVDLRLKFGLPGAETTVNTCIIIVEVAMEDESVVIGALADSVQEVVDLLKDQIEPAPKLGTQLKTEFLKGMGKHGERFILILDIDRVFALGELTQMAETAV